MITLQVCLRGELYDYTEGGLQHHVDAVVEWFEDDPAALHARFDSDPPVVWVFGRDLLIEGMLRGEFTVGGDVEVRATGDHVSLVLTSPNGTALVTFPRYPVDLFLRDTAKCVGPGSERECDLIGARIAAALGFVVGDAA